MGGPETVGPANRILDILCFLSWTSPGQQIRQKVRVLVLCTSLSAPQPLLFRGSLFSFFFFFCGPSMLEGGDDQCKMEG